jgi:endo-1,4-beta-xylanase
LHAPSLRSAKPTLREAAAQRSLLFGTAANADEFGMRNRLTEPEYAATLARHFNMLEAENAMKWSVVRPTRETYNFGPGDKLETFAAANGMKLRGHVLVWHSGLPSWLTPFAASATPAQMSALLEDHIRTVVGHYKGKVFAWDVVNEAFNDPSGSALPTLRASVWNNQPGIGQPGTAYIEQAFRWAHEADPTRCSSTTTTASKDPGPSSRRS